MTSARAGGLVLVAAIACACGEPARPGGTVPSPASTCAGAGDALATAAAARADGHLSRALAGARDVVRRCPSQAAARQVMRLAIGKSLPMFPREAIYPLPSTVPWFDRILVSGSTVARAPRLEQSLLMILDALQPVGIATIILDQNNLVGAIGAGAEIDPVLAVHVLESSAFMNLGTVISPVGKARGGLLMRIQLVRDGQKEPVIDVKEGGLQVIPLPAGKAADLYVQPMQSVNIGLGPGRGGWVRRVVGGTYGLIIDARGRPIQVPGAFNRRQEALLSWQTALSGF